MEVAEEVNEDGAADDSATTSAPHKEGVTYYAVHIPNMGKSYFDTLSPFSEWVFHILLDIH